MSRTKGHTRPARHDPTKMTQGRLALLSIHRFPIINDEMSKMKIVKTAAFFPTYSSYTASEAVCKVGTWQYAMHADINSIS